MNIWLVVGVGILLLLVAVVLFGSRRPRRAEDELGQASRPSAPSMAPGPIDQTSVRDLLRSVQAQRKTGTLQLTAGGQSCSLYFLFGHLFHAASDAFTGEAALKQCMAWQDVRYAFDDQAQLPAAETIKRPIDEILAA